MKLPSVSPVTKEQYIKVVKAALYAFASTFIATLLASPDVSHIEQRTIISAAVAGVNAVLVLVKQAFTEGK